MDWLLILIFMCITVPISSWDNFKVKWSLTTQPIIHGNNVTLTCRSSDHVPNLHSAGWKLYINETFQAISEKTYMYPYSEKFDVFLKETEFGVVYKLIIKNFSLFVDAEPLYRCTLNFQEWESQILLSESLVRYLPLKEEVNISKTLQEDRLSLYGTIERIFPLPVCYLYIQEDDYSSNLTTVSTRQHKYYYSTYISLKQPILLKNIYKGGLNTTLFCNAAEQRVNLFSEKLHPQGIRWYLSTKPIVHGHNVTLTCYTPVQIANLQHAGWDVYKNGSYHYISQKRYIYPFSNKYDVLLKETEYSTEYSLVIKNFSVFMDSEPLYRCTINADEWENHIDMSESLIRYIPSEAEIKVMSTMHAERWSMNATIAKIFPSPECHLYIQGDDYSSNLRTTSSRRNKYYFSTYIFLDNSILLNEIHIKPVNITLFCNAAETKVVILNKIIHSQTGVRWYLTTKPIVHGNDVTLTCYTSNPIENLEFAGWTRYLNGTLHTISQMNYMYNSSGKYAVALDKIKNEVVYQLIIRNFSLFFDAEPYYRCSINLKEWQGRLNLTDSIVRYLPTKEEINITKIVCDGMWTFNVTILRIFPLPKCSLFIQDDDYSHNLTTISTRRHRFYFAIYLALENPIHIRQTYRGAVDANLYCYVAEKKINIFSEQLQSSTDVNRPTIILILVSTATILMSRRS